MNVAHIVWRKSRLDPIDSKSNYTILESVLEINSVLSETERVYSKYTVESWRVY